MADDIQYPGRPWTLEERLQGFVKNWHDYYGSELAGGQQFLWALLDAYDVKQDPGTIFEQHPILSKPRKGTTQGDLFGSSNGVSYMRDRMDMYLPRICVWEMKEPREKDLGKFHDQLLNYWKIVRTRYMVLCNFHEFWVYDTDEEMGHLEPAVRFKIEELPKFAESLLFLRGEETHFARRSERVTQQMGQNIGHLLREVLHREEELGHERGRVVHFFLQCLFALFGEDAGLLPKGLFTDVLKLADSSGSMAPVYTLFDDFARRDAQNKNYPYAPFVNGRLFGEKQPRVSLEKPQVKMLYEAARDFDWDQVRPEIFGSIFEQALFAPQRHTLGAHFTREEDIMKVVLPTVLQPWRTRIHAIRTVKDCQAAIDAMRAFHVLDPACGCGNFLYVTYREMKRLEATLRERWHFSYLKVAKRWKDIPPPPPGPYFSLGQLHGIEIDGFAAQLARVVLWIGEYLAVREHGLDEETLPLKDLQHVIEQKDALFDPWPRPEGTLAIVGNPPYMGVRKLRAEKGDEYVERLFAAYPNNRAADFVTYWFPPALRALRPGERAGFVTTNSIAQNESRKASIDAVLMAGGTLTNCWKSYSWPGDAAVYVSIVNWTMGPDEGVKSLDGHEVAAITPGLTNAVDVTSVATLRANEGLSFMGVTVGNEGFVLDDEQRHAIIADDPASAAVIKPYLNGRDLNREPDQRSTRWVIDFGMMEKEEAECFVGAFRHVQREVYPIRKDNRREARAKHWWRFMEPAPNMRAALEGAETYLAFSRVSPHMLLYRVDSQILPDSQLIIVALDSMYAFGLLQSRYHEVWAWHRCSTLGEGLRYTPTTAFETFPFPLQPDGSYNPRVVPPTRFSPAVCTIAEALYTRRAAICQERKLGLTKVYNLMHTGELPDLQALHDHLNDAVTICYGWAPGTWRDENAVLSGLRGLNGEIAGRG